MYHKKTHIHFIGIGGIGMSGIAKILRTQGYTISGCDTHIDSNIIRELQNLGCTIYQGNNTQYCHDTTIDTVVHTSEVKQNHPELIAAQQRNIPIIKRALMLAELMRSKFSIAISGSHGKTTTTSLISHILLFAKKDPTVVIGGVLATIGSNAQQGSGEFLVAEADESDRSLLHLPATLAVVTNIDLEHLETYKNIDDIKQTFLQFLKNLPFYGKTVICLDDQRIQSIMEHIDSTKLITYGLATPALWSAKNITLNPSGSIWTVTYQNNPIGSITLPIPGRHNILNALAAIAVAHDLEIPFDTIQQALACFGGVDRRFTFRGTYKQAELFDDYGHHPEEIRNTLLVARARTQGKLTVVFQPHRYTRTHALWNDFVQVLADGNIDHLIITDIYPAFETPIPEVTSANLVKAIIDNNPACQVTYIPWENAHEKMVLEIDKHAPQPGLILFQGAGKINTLARYLQKKN